MTNPKQVVIQAKPEKLPGEAVFMGIDPGVTGALAVIGCIAHKQQWRVLYVTDIPTFTIVRNSKNVRRVDARALARLMRPWVPICDSVAVEMVFAPPGIMSTAAFSLGYTACAIDTALINCGINPQHKKRRDVTAGTWKKALRLPQHKEAARAMATQVLGDDARDMHWYNKGHHNRAEAALIAVWSALFVPKDWKPSDKQKEKLKHERAKQDLASSLPDSPPTS